MFTSLGGFIGDPFFVEVADLFAVLEEDFEVAGLNSGISPCPEYAAKMRNVEACNLPTRLWSDPMI